MWHCAETHDCFRHLERVVGLLQSVFVGGPDADRAQGHV